MQTHPKNRSFRFSKAMWICFQSFRSCSAGDCVRYSVGTALYSIRLSAFFLLDWCHRRRYRCRCENSSACFPQFVNRHGPIVYACGAHCRQLCVNRCVGNTKYSVTGANIVVLLFRAILYVPRLAGLFCVKLLLPPPPSSLLSISH